MQVAERGLQLAPSGCKWLASGRDLQMACKWGRRRQLQTYVFLGRGGGDSPLSQPGGLCPGYLERPGNSENKQTLSFGM